MVTSPSAKLPFLEDQVVSLSLASLLRPVLLGRPCQEHKVTAGITHKDIEPHKSPHHDKVETIEGDSRNTRSNTNLEEEEIVDAPGNDGNASMPEKVKRPNP